MLDSDEEMSECTPPISPEPPEVPIQKFKIFSKCKVTSERIDYMDITNDDEEHDEQKATIYTPAATPPIRKTKVTQEILNQERTKLYNLKQDLQLISKAQNVKLTNLADRGMKISAKIALKTKEIVEQEAYLETICVENVDSGRRERTIPTQYLSDLGASASNIRLQYGRSQNVKRTIDTTAAILKSIHEAFSTCPEENQLAEQPCGLKKIKLMVHQLFALRWMEWCEKKRPYGGILADDMGVGKTMTALSLVLSRKNNADDDEHHNDDDCDSDYIDDDYDIDDDFGDDDFGDDDSNIDEGSSDGKLNFAAIKIENRKYIYHTYYIM